MNIRLATLEDAEEIQKVNTEELHYDYPLGKAKEMLELILSLDWQVIYVAEIDGSLLAMCRQTNIWELLVICL